MMVMIFYKFSVFNSKSHPRVLVDKGPSKRQQLRETLDDQKSDFLISMHDETRAKKIICIIRLCRM